MPIKHSGTGTTAVGSCSCSYSLFTLLKTHRALFTVTFLALFAMVFLCHLYISPIMFTPTPSHTDPYHTLFLSLASNYTAAHHLRALTAHPHIAGSGANSDLAIYVSGVLSSHSFHTHFSIHSVLLSRPLSRSLTLSLPNPSHDRHSPPTFSFALTQRTYSHDPYADQASEVAPTFHAFAKSGTAVGAVVYVNYGRVEDYQSLREKGVDVSGAIVLARYGKIYRGDIVRNADTAGAVGVVVYTDRIDYGGGGTGIGFPLGKWMPESGVQMGMVYMGVGDPTTPGWGSRVGGCERLSEEEMEKMGVFPRIPSLPVSMQDGEMILKEIGGPEADEAWQVDGGGGGEEMVYRLGPGPAFLNLSYYGKNEFKNIQNVFGVIEGKEEPDRYILLGNHRDAWAFGAADPNSGTAALLEIAERFHKLQKKGWKPRRTIMFCNWDAEEYGMIGSTEWVEGNKELITSKVVAYLNVDVAVAGSGFNAAATPQLDDLIKEATRKVQDPDNSSRTLYESWTVTAGSPPLVERLGRSGSDHVSFVHHVGIPSSDIYFGQDYPVYHSMFDDFVWMEKYGDPMFHRHAAAASVWGLVALKLADEEFLPFNYLSYVSELLASTKELEDYLSQTPSKISVVPIYHSIEELKKAANKISADKKALERNSSPLKWRNNPLKVRELNDRLMMAERAFTDQEGLVGRIWYKNLIYGPSFNDDYGSKSFPGVNAAIKKAKKENTKKTWRSVQHEVWRVSRVIAQVSFVLRGEFS